VRFEGTDDESGNERRRPKHVASGEESMLRNRRRPKRNSVDGIAVGRKSESVDRAVTRYLPNLTLGRFRAGVPLAVSASDGSQTRKHREDPALLMTSASLALIITHSETTSLPPT